jgi:hypothetical protein
MTKHSAIPFAFIALLAFSACQSFDPGSLIAGPRVLGARVEVQGEPERASPKPEETVEVHWISAFPGEPRPLHWVFAACLPDAAASGACAAAPLDTAEGEGLEPVFTFQIPRADLLIDAKSIQVLGLICDAGTPSLEGALPHCAGERAHGTSVELEITLDLGVYGNLNPELDDASIKLDDQAWHSLTMPSASTGCAANTALMQVKANAKKHVIQFELGADVRELYTMPETGRSELEGLQLSQFVTGGELAGQYSFVAASDPAERPQLSVIWHAPKAKAVSADGELVRFVLVVRDLRGGLAVTERALCAVR